MNANENLPNSKFHKTVITIFIAIVMVFLFLKVLFF
ncbi:MAG: hypothetical protein RLZ27_478 [Pseudomonadota bacterium]|jgi:hypothetical protein